MKKRHSIAILTAALSLIISLAGCQSRQQPTAAGETAAAAPSRKAVAEVATIPPSPTPSKVLTETQVAPPTRSAQMPAPTPSPESGPGLDTDQDSDELPWFDYAGVQPYDVLDSYRIEHTLDWEAEGAPADHVVTVIEFTREPRVERYVTMSEGSASEPVEMIHTETGTFVSFAGRWQAIEGEASRAIAQSGWMGSPSELLGAQVGMYVGRETIDGRQADHYRSEQGIGMLLASLGKAREARADVWVDSELNTYLLVVIEWHGTDTQDRQASLRMETRLVEFNSGMEIEIPSIATADPYADIPIPDSSEGLLKSGGRIQFRVPMTAEAVTEFYDAELDALGWKRQEGPVPIVLTFEREGESMQVLLSESEDTTEVTIVRASG